MTLTSVTDEISGAAPRGRFDMPSAGEDAEAWANLVDELIDAEYEEYVSPMNHAW
jgi:hypothetical protein